MATPEEQKMADNMMGYAQSYTNNGSRIKSHMKYYTLTVQMYVTKVIIFLFSVLVFSNTTLGALLFFLTANYVVNKIYQDRNNYMHYQTYLLGISYMNAMYEGILKGLKKVDVDKQQDDVVE